LRKKSGQVKFVEQGFVQDLLMWWNDGFGTLKYVRIQRTQKREPTTTLITRTDRQHGWRAG
jgi:hypothetical protein